MNLSSTFKDLEELTLNAKQIQDDMLEEILRVNANTEYLQRYLHGSFDKELFKKNVPMVDYEDIKPYIDRVANGESSNVISGETITQYILSSGTSGGKQKIFPVNNKYFKNPKVMGALRSSIISKYVDGLEEGKQLSFLNSRPISKTPSGLHVATVSTSILMTDGFKNRASKCFTSPYEVIMCTDQKQSMYCHLLCGLVLREEVLSLEANFASTIFQAINLLETHWKELCENIRSGYISEWITDLGCRKSISIILGKPNSKLADLIEDECSHESWEGIITRLWPNTKFIHSIVTGQMSQYISILEFYTNKLPIISSIYTSSETTFGLNVNPLCRPEDVSYTFMPNMSYFEFLQVDEGNSTDEIVDLVDVKLGCFYETLVTTQFGLYRYRMGDILEVTGFYNTAPQFRFVRRKNVVLSIDVEKTTEEDLLKALNQAKLVLETSGLMLMGFTCYTDISSVPGHYVVYWELKAKNFNGNVKLDDKAVMAECCCVMEESFNALYRNRRVNESSIGALEIRVVQQGAFESLMEYFISKGSSASQYKTPICINSPQVLTILEDKVLDRFFSDKLPPL